MIILAIETSCDETSIAILRKKKVLSNIVISQIEQQKQFGGVVPNLAANLHLKNITKLLKESLKRSGMTFEDIDYIAYTKEPGLSLCLQIGEVMAKTISLYLKKEVIPINHLQGHAYSTLLETKREWVFPVICLLISGGHTQLCLLKNHFSWEIIGDTKDDTIGECLDKTSVILGYEYPGGPVIEKLAKRGKNDRYKLTIPKNDDTLDFSFSGLKSEIVRLVNKEKQKMVEQDLACSLQHVLFQIIKKKLDNVFLSYKEVKTLVVAGGVIANNFFRDSLKSYLSEKKRLLFVPKFHYSTDNAAMIGICAYYKFLKSK